MKLSPMRQAGLCLLPIGLLLVTACGGQVTAVQSFPSHADLQSVTEPKPRPSPAIATDPQANARYDAAIEGHGERVLSAGVRICKWAKDMGAKLPFECSRGPGPVVP